MNYAARLKAIVTDPVYQITAFLFLLLCFYMPTVYHSYDKECFQSWCLNIFDNGLTKSYHGTYREMNYPPLMCYMLWLFGKFQGSNGHIEKYFHFFKIYGLLFDFAGAFLVLRFVKEKSHQILFLLLMIANPIFIYNSYMWGQLDGVLATAAFATMFFLSRKNLIAASVVYLLILNLKPQAIVFAPPLGLLAFHSLYGSVSWKDLVKAILVCTGVELILVLPFILAGEMEGVINVYLHAVGYHPKITIAAFNIWPVLVGKEGVSQNDNLKWGWLSYKQWGLLMFFTASFFALLPLLCGALAKLFKTLKYTFTNEILLLGFSLIPLVFFFFNTEMHERYSQPAMLFIAAYSFISRRYYLFLLFCFAYFCNLEPRLQGLGMSNYKIFIFDEYFVASLFAVLIESLYFFLYRDFFRLQKQTA